ncbi:energy-coupling factor transporter ATPase [Ammoniphilus oxalaticus]|uniref:Energy-coupling factor transporter ATPase n=1 Tax=Ammoniphilus oxalaticus TaxID=66863 RepID=A0A419SFY7_9BACL|nr:energy-coupling factor transporter ATPase [Ammoniphilus oxalaticus]RKD22675.1 energy-coupling factor transporter ATPase [Ammoniphilus oxalaticus]
MISFKQVCFSYEQEQPALIGIDLTIEAGEFVTIIGHNGSGKSTLAKHMNGLLQPSSGRVSVQGLCASEKENLWRIRQWIGMVFQNPDNQFVAPTVLDDVAFGLENLGVARKEMIERIEWALDQVEMWEYRDRQPHQLSGGQKQRVAVAGILAMKPKVIVLDESTAMLDPIGRQELLETMRKLHQEGITVVNITHYPDEALICDRLLVMNKGELFLQGTPQDVFKQISKLRSIQLDVPFVVELADRLRRKGVPLSVDIWKTDELVERLWNLL